LKRIQGKPEEMAGDSGVRHQKKQKMGWRKGTAKKEEYYPSWQKLSRTRNGIFLRKGGKKKHGEGGKKTKSVKTEKGYTQPKTVGGEGKHGQRSCANGAEGGGNKKRKRGGGKEHQSAKMEPT